jgi:hypothetical protein
MHVSQQLAKRNVVLQIKNVFESVGLGRVVIKHQQDAGECQHDEKVKRDSTHSPRERVTNRIAINFGRVKMKKYVGQDRERTIARIRTVMRNAKDRFPELCVLRIFISLGLVYCSGL